MELGRLLTDGADVVDLRQHAAERAQPAPITAPAGARRQARRVCQHAKTVADTEHRRVACKDCGELVDPFDALLAIADDWARHAQSRKASEAAAQLAKKRLDELLLEERRAKGRLRRMAAQERSAKKRLRILDAELGAFTPDQKPNEEE